jgi:hypothetical protein
MYDSRNKPEREYRLMTLAFQYGNQAACTEIK